MSDPIGGERLWEPDPQRACGRKVDKGFYLESGPGSPNGSLSLATLCTGDLQIVGENILCNIPPRGSHIFYPIDTLRLGEVQFAAAHVGTPDSRKAIEQIATNGTKAVGLIDHVGNQYSPVSFIHELHEYGASRRVTREMADKVLNLMGVGFTSIPIFFTHSHIPLLDIPNGLVALDLIDQLFDMSDSPMYLKASYTHPLWGMRRQKWGGIWEENPAAAYYILGLANAVAQAADDSRYAAAKPIFDHCLYKEQLLCSSWIRAVCYVTRTGDVPNDVLDGGYTILDLSKQKDVEESGMVSVLEIEPTEEE